MVISTLLSLLIAAFEKQHSAINRQVEEKKSHHFCTYRV